MDKLYITSLDVYLQISGQWLSRQLPARISPRIVSLLGHFAAVLAALLILSQPLGIWCLTLAGFMHLIYTHLDAVDGILARRNGFWPQHCYFDHGLDILVSLYYCAAFAAAGFVKPGLAFGVAACFSTVFSINQLLMHATQRIASIGVSELNFLIALLLILSPIVERIKGRLIVFTMYSVIGYSVIIISIVLSLYWIRQLGILAGRRA